MDMLEKWWPLLVVGLLVVVVARRLRGEPLDLKDAIVSPAILLFLGGRAVFAAHPTAIDLVWLGVLSVIGLGFGAARSATTRIEQRDDVWIQRYRWATIGLMAGSLVVSAGLGYAAQQLGMHPEARPLTLSIGIGLAGESAVTLWRASRRGVPMPYPLGEERAPSMTR